MLAHQISYAGVEDVLLQQMARAGHEPPAALSDPPPLHPGLELYLAAFWELDAGRQAGFAAMQGLAFVEIDAYARGLGLTGRGRERFLTFVRRLDVESRRLRDKKG